MPPAFPKTEYRDRLARARHLLRDQGLDGCICIAPELLYYFAGHEAYTFFSDQALIFTTGDDEPSLVIREVDEPVSRETAWISDFRTFHYGKDDPADLVGEAVREKGLVGKKIAADLGSFSASAGYVQRLRDALAPSQIVDATEAINSLRLVKSPNEIAYIREAASYANVGMEAAVAAMRPGISEIQLAAEIEYAMRSRGCDYAAMPTWVRSGPRSPNAHSQATGRVMENGDVVCIEFAGIARRYQCVTMKTFSLGDPSTRVRAMHEAGRDSLLTGARAIAVGERVAAAEEASINPMERRGFSQFSNMRFGIGISAAYPPSWVDTMSIIKESKEVFRAGMSFYLHTSIQIPDEGIGALVGASYLLTDEGLEQLTPGTEELAVIS